MDSNRLKNLLHPDEPAHGAGQTEFHELTCKAHRPAGAIDGSPAYLALLAEASDGFVSKHYGLQPSSSSRPLSHAAQAS